MLSSNISSTRSHNMVNFGPLAAKIGLVVWAPLQISTGFASWQHYCMVLQYWASAKLCGVDQSVPPIFRRAAITLGTGPHSSSQLFCGRPHEAQMAGRSGLVATCLTTECEFSGLNITTGNRVHRHCDTRLECGPMPNVMVARPNIGGALCSVPQSLADAQY